MYRPFRFGVITGNALSHTEWITKARKAEELGYATLLVPDHITVGIAPLTALAVAAEATTRLRIGSLVFGNDFRHPALLAREVATLDLLSEGRFELGLGAGYLSIDYIQTGIPFDAPGRRISRLEEAVHVMKQVFTGEIVNFSGTYYHLSEMQGKPVPIQKPHPPIYIGGTGKRLLSIAAQHADSVGMGFTDVTGTLTATPPEEITQKIAWVQEAAQQRFDQLELGYTVYHVIVSDGKTGGQEEQEHTKPPASLPEDCLHVLTGSRDQIVEELLTRRERYGFSYIQITERHMEAFAPVVARLAGK